MSHVLADPQGLSERARCFLRTHASLAPFDAAAGPSDEELRQQLRMLFGATDDAVLSRLRAAQARYGGLRYYSPMFREDIVFAPWPEYEAEDGEPIAWFIDHTVAYPWVVWMLADGKVAYCFPGPHMGEVVPVFPTGDALIESDALHQECTDWTPVHPAVPLEAEAVQAAANRARLPLLEAASGFTEWWWELDRFRLHVSLTFAKVFGEEREARWRVWADSPAGERAARSFLAQAQPGH